YSYAEETSRPGALDFRLKTSRLRTRDSRLETQDSRLKTPDSLQVARQVPCYQIAREVFERGFAHRVMPAGHKPFVISDAPLAACLEKQPRQLRGECGVVRSRNHETGRGVPSETRHKRVRAYGKPRPPNLCPGEYSFQPLPHVAGCQSLPHYIAKITGHMHMNRSLQSRLVNKRQKSDA